MKPFRISDTGYRKEIAGAALSRSPSHRSGFRYPVSSIPHRGSVLVIVLWICLGLVALTLYFANSMSSELRAADNRVSETNARQAVMGGIRYANYILTNNATGGRVPSVIDNQDYRADMMPVGDAYFWFIGRDNDNTQSVSPTEPYFALVDESSKLNLNTATSAMLQSLPGMTPDLADAIVAWRNTNTASMTAADADNTYTAMDPPRHNKSGSFESIDELRLLNTATLDVLFGEDTNRNGVLDPNEDDGDTSAPHDNQDGQLQAGVLEYLTVYSRLPATSANGQRRINLTQLNTQQLRQALSTRLQNRGIQRERVTQIMLRVTARLGIISQSTGGRGSTSGGRGGTTGGTTIGGNGQGPFTSVMDFMLTAQLTPDEFALVHTDLTVTSNSNGTESGLVNVNTASATVLGCIPGIGPDNAPNVISYRQAHPDQLTSFAWLAQVLPPNALRQAGRYITDQSYQFCADVAAVATNGRGYHREKVIFDTSGATPRIVYRQDLTPWGWALGRQVRQDLRAVHDNNNT